MRVSKLAVVRIGGNAQIKKELSDTLRILRLTRPNYCTLVENDSNHRGMLQKVKEIVTWGPVNLEVLEKLLREKGKFENDGSVSDETVKEFTQFDSVEEFAQAIYEGEVDLGDLEEFRNVFRLHPPKKGYRNTDRAFLHGGATGDRGEEINELLPRMF